MYINSHRKCKNELPFDAPIWLNTFKYCITELHRECPFFIGINKVGKFCEYFLNCSECKGCKIHARRGFDEIIKKYCFSDDNVDCSRYKLKKSGEKVPSDLFPDGSRL